MKLGRYLKALLSPIIILSILFSLSLAYAYAEEPETNLDVMYEEGQRLLASSDSQDIAKGIALMLTSANAGSAKAMIQVGMMYTNGLGRLLSEDFEEGQEAERALSWYEKAAETGEKEAAASAITNDAFSYFLGSEDGPIKEDDAVALNYFMKAAELGDSRAINMMVAFYTYGFGVAQDPDKALELCSALASKGDPDALYALEDYAYAYYAGTKDGIDINFNTAFQYYMKLTEFGNERAMYNVGLLYEYGLGTSKDHAKAIEWVTKALDAGYEPAKAMLEELSK